MMQEMMQQNAFLTNALHLCGVTRKRRRCRHKARKTVADPDMLQITHTIREERPFGTKRMAADLPRRLGRQVNRKLVRCIYKRMGWNQSNGAPQGTKTRWKPVKASRPDQIRETAITCVWFGSADGWCYSFNVLDILTRQCIAYRFSAPATTDVARVAGGCRRCCQAGLPCACPPVRQRFPVCGQNIQKDRIPSGHQPHIHSDPHARAERSHGIFIPLKQECIWPHDFANYQEAETVIAEAFKDCNQARLHSALKYVPPDELATSWEAGHK